MIKKIVIPLLLLIGLVVGLVLVKNSQYLGRKATGEKVNVMFSPSINLDNVGIGSTFRLKVIGSVSGGPGFGVMNVGLKYDKSKLELMRNQDDEIEVRLNSKFRGDGTFRQVTNIPGETFNILEILATIAQTRPQITGGEIGAGDPLIDVKFKVLALGQAEVGFVSGDNYKIAGATAEGGLVIYDLVKTGGGEPKETLSLGAGPTNTSAPPTATGVPPTATSVPPTATGVPSSPIPTATKTPTPTPTPTTPASDDSCKTNQDCGWCGDVCKKKVPGENCITIAPPPGYDCVCGTDGSCRARLITDIEETPIPTAKITPEAKVTAVATISPAKAISFEVVLAGVKDYSKCLGENKVDVILLKDNVRKEYKNVSLVETGKKTTKNERIFLVDKLNIADFGESTGVAIFVKGPRHMQMKFGINGQDDVYNKSGGELAINNSMVFDFSKYPILAGDVNRDGLVDGVDFVEVKKRASAFEQVDEGQYNSYDLDGSCVVNNQDVVLLVQALNEKYDQMY